MGIQFKSRRTVLAKIISDINRIGAISLFLFPLPCLFILLTVRTNVVFLGYQAVICGMDPVCCESSSWMETAQVEKLPRGSNQPFYQV